VRKCFSNKQGFTLVEVIVSITILSIIILTFSSIFLFTNNTANRNNEKLVAVHLAKATLESVKGNPSYYFVLTETGITPGEGFQFENDSIKITQVINNQNYEVKIKPSRDNGQKELSLVHVLVETKLLGSKTPITSKVEGYVNYAQ
jgi:prepilin-type N-terminal cleavage/methylation domain-containing protein